MTDARISRVHGSWRVRVPGHPPKFFADSAYDFSERKSLQAARAWRDKHWNGRNRNEKLTAKQRAEIRRSKGKRNYRDVADDYNISPDYVHKLWRE